MSNTYGLVLMVMSERLNKIWVRAAQIAQAPFAMAASLERLPPDCISTLVEWLDIDGFRSLMSTGSRVLRHKLKNVYGLCFEAAHATKMPFAVLSLPKLRSLSIYGIKEDVAFLDFTDGSDSELARGSKTLEKLVLAFRNAFALFWSPSSDSLTVPIRDRFPALSTLIFRGVTCEKSVEMLFGELPDTLTTFELSYARSQGFETFNLATVAKLPRYLSTLQIHVDNICEPEGTATFEIAKVLPPNLTTLKLATLDRPTILDHLPSTLTNLFFCYDKSDSFVWQSSKIPPKLVQLAIVSSGWRIDWDEPLPSTLEQISWEGSAHVFSGLKISRLPPKMRRIPEALFTQEFAGLEPEKLFPAVNTMLTKFSNLRSAIIFGKENLRHLPSTLECLHMPVGADLDFPLPSGLTDLYLYSPMKSKDLVHVPKTLAHLALESVRTSGGSVLKTDRDAAYPPWNETDMSQLERFTGLISLNISRTRIESGSSLAPLSKLKILKHFYLTGMSLQDMITSPQWLHLSLPPSLTEMRLSYNSDEDVGEEKSISDEWLSACNLDSVTPDLKLLKLHGVLPKSIVWGKSFITLPCYLKELQIDFTHSDLELGTVVNLPPTLTSLHLLLRKQLTGPLTNEHFDGLPDSLAELKIAFGPELALNEDLLDLLPENIAVLDFTPTDESIARSPLFQALVMSSDCHLGDNKMLRGFLPQI